MFNDETPFFLSYPRVGTHSSGRRRTPPASELVQKFFDSLCEDVAELIDLPAGCDMGFMDTVGLPGGMSWHDELIRALGSCQVLVGLLSMRYLRSEWCGKEWNAFALRHRASAPSASPHQGSIIPVRWAPLVGKDPAVVMDHVSIFQPKATRRNPELPQRYNEEGVFRLLQRNEEDSVGEIVWQLARRIQEIYYGQRLEPRQFQPDELANAFGEGEP